MAGCLLHGYQCGGNCISGNMAAQQQMGMSDYNRYLHDQMGRAMQQATDLKITNETAPKKQNKLLLLLR